MSERVINLTSAEIGALWTDYQSKSLAKYMLQFMLKHIKDSDIYSVAQSAYNNSSADLEVLHDIFDNAQFATPIGFSEEDVNMDAPWLFSDMFCLSYTNFMAKVGMVTYSTALAMSHRTDIRQYFTKVMSETNTLFNQSMDILLKKGANARHPYIEVPNETDFIDNKSYLSGLNPFSDKRPINAIELSHLYTNILTNSTGMKLCIAFAQTSPNKEVQEYMLRLKEVAKKHVKFFSDKMLDEDIEVPQLPDVGVSSSTTQTFSDKMMMYHITVIIAAGIGNYATAGAASQRSDLAVNYERLSLEVSRLAKSGGDIMIKHHWLEQPPGTKNLDKLLKKKNDN